LKANLRKFLKWFSNEYGVQDFGVGIKLKQVKEERIKSDLISYEDCVKLIKVCLNQRDRAMIAFLLDSGVRRGELLKIRYSDVKFENNAVVVHVPRGKTSPRRVYCVWCAQDMYHWYKQHPLKEPNSYFFCSFRRPFGQLSQNGFGEQIRDIAVRAGMPHIHAHLFRHSSATLYAAIEGMTDQKLKYRYGWTPSSKMADVYIKLSGAESDDDIRVAFGKPVIKIKVAGKTMVTCPVCHWDNYVDDDRCYNCGKALSDKAIAEDKAIEEAKEEAKEAAIIEKLKQKLLDELAANQQKLIAFSGESFTDEQLCELEKIDDENPQPIVDVLEGGSPLRGISDYSPDIIPEEEADIIKRILKPKEKME
jgi:hypothetical protein